ncbi:MAG: hypothetical protein R6U19_06165 [Bacteroidales bacterium]
MITSKTLLIAYYWYPYNNSGTMRWLQFSKYMDFDVLTTKVPIQSQLDETLPKTNKHIIRFGKNFPAIVWGFLALFKVLFLKYDRYIVTCPPESLLIGAFLLQLFGKNVIVDMRDKIKREEQPVKILIPVYNFFYRRIKKIIVAWKFIDNSKPVVYHGYELQKANKFIGYYKDRVDYGKYIKRMKKGLIPDQSNKPRGYAASSLHSFIHLNFPINNDFHEEVYTVKPQSYKKRAMEMNVMIDNYNE